MKEKFFAFLKKNRVHRKFVDNCKSITFLEHIAEGISSNSPKSLVGGAFIWADTNQGHRFWSKINDLWLKELEKLPPE